MSTGVEATSPFEDQDFRLAPATTTFDDEVLAAAHAPGLSRGMSAMRYGGRGLPAPILCLLLGPRSVAGGGCRSACDDLGGGILAVS